MRAAIRARDNKIIWGALAMLLVWSWGCIVIDDEDFEGDDEQSTHSPPPPDEHRLNNESPDITPPTTTPPPMSSDTPVFGVRGTVVAAAGASIPEQAQVVAIWQVSSTSPDTLVKFGHGRAQGSSFQLDFYREAPIDSALNESALGVAFILLLPAHITLPEDGALDREAFRMLEQNTLGISAAHGVIYHAPYEGSYRFDWAASFPQGVYNCGALAESSDGDQFEDFAPVGCEEVEIQITPMLDWIDWT